MAHHRWDPAAEPLNRRRFIAVAGAGALSACARSVAKHAATPPTAVATAESASAASTTIASPIIPTTTVPLQPTTTSETPSRSYDATKSLWSQGNYAAVSKEVDAVNLTVTGSLPPELDGLYVRNGANPKREPDIHWFLGDGMVHGVRLEKGKASWYRNRWVKTAAFDVGLRADGKIPGLANNTSNTSMLSFGNKLLSLQEIGWPYELNPNTLDTVGPWDMGRQLKTAMTAHPKIDPVTGKLHFYGTGFAPPFLTYHVANADGTLMHSTEISTPGPTMIHDFAITDQDVIFWDLPVTFSLDTAINKPKSMPYLWDDTYHARIGVMPLGGNGTDIRWVEIDPCYVFHAANAWREGNDVVIDVSRLPSMFKDGKDLPGAGSLVRWRIGTGGPSLTFSQTEILPRQIDLPTINLAQTGRPHTAAYYATTRDLPGGWEFAGIAALDPKTGTLDEWDPGQHVSAGEPLVVGDYVLVFAYDHNTAASTLLVFSAQRVKSGPIASVALPQRVPFGFHGTWLPGGVPRG